MRLYMFTRDKINKTLHSAMVKNECTRQPTSYVMYYSPIYNRLKALQLLCNKISWTKAFLLIVFIATK